MKSVSYAYDNELMAVLTVRERDVMSLMMQGRANKIIADELGISIRTVEVHRARVMSKLGVRNAVELVLAVHRHRSAAALGANPRFVLNEPVLASAPAPNPRSGHPH